MQIVFKQIPALLIVFCVCIDLGYTQTNNCGPERFQCNNGECISGELLCDGKANCKDLSDETETECKKQQFVCPEYAFRCNYGACVNGDAACNGVQDCADNSDETQPHCATGANNQTERPVPCKMDQYKCENGQCIRDTDVCDGSPDCADGSDEIYARCGALSCTSTTFQCVYGACIDGDLRCNGIRNCADGSDEKGCGAGEWPSPLPTLQPTSPRPTPSITPSYPRPTPTPRPTPRPPVTPGARTCKAPPQPPNGRWKLHRLQCLGGEDCDVPEGEELGLGSHLVYSCNPGYRIRGPTDVSCSFEGRWLNIPVCIEIRCRALSTASTEARCTYDDEWVSCEAPVLPRTRATIACRTSYRRESSLLSTQRERVRCNTEGRWEPEPIRCVPVCGVLPPDVTPLVVDGVTPNITEFPWHASLYRHVSPDKPKKYFCGASIIQENLLLTAAHCIFDENERTVINAERIYVATGNIFRDYDSLLHDQRLVKKNQVKNIYIVCNYLGLVGNYISDIAILELVEPFVLSTWLVPVCVDPFSDQTILEAGIYGKVAGFGRTRLGESSAVLQALTVPYIPYNQCKSASLTANTEQYITNDKFCAGYMNGSAVCDGDSGGGLVFKTNGLWYIRGIVSVSLGTILHGGRIRCDHNLYSLYTRVFSHIGWIQEIIARLEQNQPYQSCPK